MSEPRLVTTRAAGEILNLTEGAVAKLCANGRLRDCYKEQGRWHIPLASVYAYERSPRGRPRKKSARWLRPVCRWNFAHGRRFPWALARLGSAGFGVSSAGLR